MSKNETNMAGVSENVSGPSSSLSSNQDSNNQADGSDWEKLLTSDTAISGEYQKALERFLQQEKELEKLFEKKLNDKRGRLEQQQLLNNGNDETKAKIQMDAELFRKKKNIDDETEKLVKNFWDQFNLKAAEMREELEKKIETLTESKRKKFEEDRKRLKEILESEIQGKRKLFENECVRLERVSNLPITEMDRRDFIKKVLVDYKNYPSTIKLADEFALKRQQGLIGSTIVANNTCMIYEGSYQNQSCCVKVVVMTDRNIGYKMHIEESTKIRRFLSKTQPKHETLIRLFEIFLTETKVYIFMDECGKKNLLQLAKERTISMIDLNQHMKTILSCLEFLHQRAIAHLKIRPESVLFDLQGHVKLAGFGNASVYFDPNRESFLKLSRHETRHRFRDNHFPEEVFREDFDPQPVDVYSLGLMIYIVINFINNKFDRKKARILTKIDPELITDPILEQLISETTNYDPKKRCKLFDLRHTINYFM